MKKTAAFTLIAFAGSLAIAGAEGRSFGDGDLPEQIKELADTDFDGVVTEEEWQAFRDARRAERDERRDAFVADWDTDDDGVLSDEEKEAAREAIRAQKEANRAERFAEADTDGSGGISAEEFAAIPPIARLAADHPDRVDAIFARLDTDDSGEISEDEFLGHLDHRRPIGPRPPRPGHGPGGDEPGGEGPE